MKNNKKLKLAGKNSKKNWEPSATTLRGCEGCGKSYCLCSLSHPGTTKRLVSPPKLLL